MRLPTQVRTYRCSLLLVLAGFLSACGGGGGGTAAVSTASGTIEAAGDTVSDSDTNDPLAGSASNNIPALAQPIPKTAIVGGYVTAVATGVTGDAFASSPDPVDHFQTSLIAGQGVTLTIADHGSTFPNPDIDLYLYRASDPTNPVAFSLGTGPSEQIIITDSDDYILRVLAFSGGSNYTLSVTQQATATSTDPDFVPGELLVRFQPSAKAVNTKIQQWGMSAVDHTSSGLMRLRLPADSASRSQALSALSVGTSKSPNTTPNDLKLDTLLARKALLSRNDVASADLNYIYRPQARPNDPFYGLQWHYPLINLPQAWDVETGNSNPVTVAVVDTGVVLSHPDLQGQLVAGYDFISDPVRAADGNGIDANPDDPGDGQTPGGSSFHGTHVAGTIAAAANNNLGVAGVAWGARIMPIRALGQGGGTSFDIIQGARYAAGLSNSSGTTPSVAADIINLSLGCIGCFSATEQAEYQAIRDSGVILIAAAGNENTSQLGYPASYPSVISVAAVDRFKNRAPYSNFGSTVAVSAPGGDGAVDADGDGYPDGVLSTSTEDSSGSRQNIYGFSSGTSMASPHVAGVVALMKSVNPLLSPDQIDALLTAGELTEDIAANGASVRDDIYGYGVIDALKAITAAQSGTIPTSLGVSPNTLRFPVGVSSQTLTLSATGSGSVVINSLTPSASWLSVTGTGVGGYRINADRTGLANGNYPATIIINYSIEGVIQEINIPVNLTVGNLTLAAGDTGYTYVILVDISTDETVATAQSANDNGEYRFSFSDIPAGDYLLIAGSDADNDEFICDAGESCGGYPTLAQLQPIALSGGDNRSGLTFVSSFELTLGTAANAASKASTSGYRKFPMRSKQLVIEE